MVKTSSWLPAAALFCALIAAPAGAQAEPVDLFAAAGPSAAPSSAAPSDGATRERFAAINADALLAAPQAPASPAAGTELRLNLFPGVAATFAIRDVKPAFGGGSIIRAKSGEDGEATLVVADGKVTGRVLLRGKTYRIRPTGGRLHAIAEMSRSLLPPNGPELPSPVSERRASAATPDEPSSAPVEIDVMFVYTLKARKASADILSEIDFAVAITNEAYEASGVGMRLRLVRTLQSGKYDEDATDDYNAPLRDITGPAAGAGAQTVFFDQTRTQRDRFGADLVVLLREGGGYCGVGWVNTSPAGYSAWAYSVVSRGCIVYDTVAHETGHNMGLRHDRYVSDPAPDSEFNYGYVSIPARAMDIMAYENRCRDAGLSCEYKRIFSNPGIRVNGKPFGISPGSPGAAHATRWLNTVRGTVKSFRPTRVPSTPALAAAK